MLKLTFYGYIYIYIYMHAVLLVNLSAFTSQNWKSPYTFEPLIYDDFIARLIE